MVWGALLGARGPHRSPLHSVGEKRIVAGIIMVGMEEGRNRYIWICFERRVNRSGGPEREKEKRSKDDS